MGALGVPFWCTECTWCTILVHRMHYFGALGVPFWCTECTWCTILVHRMHYFGALGVPFWCTECTILVHLVYHFGALGVPPRVKHPFRITSQFPKNEPDSGNTPLDHHGTFEKSPTKTPAGPDGPALVSPNTQAGPRRRRQKIRWLHHTPAGAVIHLEAPNDHHTSMISNDGRTPNTTMTAAIQDRQHSPTRRSGPTGPSSVISSNLRQTTRPIRQNRQETSDPTASGTQDRTLHTAAPNRTCHHALEHPTSSHSPHPINFRLPGPTLRAGPNHLSSVF